MAVALLLIEELVESFKAENVRLTVGLQVQEATLQEFFNKSGALARGTGFLCAVSCRMAHLNTRLSSIC